MALRHLFDADSHPFAELQREFNRLFDTMVPRRLGLIGSVLSQAGSPVNVYDDKDSLFVECEAPGLDQQTLEVYVTGDVLTLKGERPALKPQEGTTVHMQERGYGTFNRAVQLPVAVEGDKAEARYENGILRVKLPKAPQARTRQVTVKVE